MTDVPQMHSYDSQHDAVGTGPLIAGWTQKLWQAQAKPNLIGEFGTSDQRLQPALLHNGIWAGLAAGGAATPMEWNDPGAWGRMSDDMLDHMSYLAAFVGDLPLAVLAPVPLQVMVEGDGFQAWGLVGQGGGLASAAEGPALSTVEGTAFFWVQDLTPGDVRAGVAVTVAGLSPGVYTVRPFDTWQGIYLDTSQATADRSGRMTILLPPFTRDIAVRLNH